MAEFGVVADVVRRLEFCCLNLEREYCTSKFCVMNCVLFVDWRARRASLASLKWTKAYESCRMRHSTISP